MLAVPPTVTPVKRGTDASTAVIVKVAVLEPSREVTVMISCPVVASFPVTVNEAMPLVQVTFETLMSTKLSPDVWAIVKY